MSDDLAEFLLVRIAEDEAAAASVAPLGHNFDMGGNRQDERFSHRRYSQSPEDGASRLANDDAAAAHFARHEPARVLRECEAKRRIVEGATRERKVAEAGSRDARERRWAYLDVLAGLASAYSDHPDYRDEWRP